MTLKTQLSQRYSTIKNADFRELAIEFVLLQFIFALSLLYARGYALWELVDGSWGLETLVNFDASFTFLVLLLGFGFVASPFLMVARRIVFCRLDRLSWPVEVGALAILIGVVLPTLLIVYGIVSDPSGFVEYVTTELGGAPWSVATELLKLYGAVALVTVIPVVLLWAAHRALEGRLQIGEDRGARTLVFSLTLLLMLPVMAGAAVPPEQVGSDEPTESDYKEYETTNLSAYDDGHYGPNPRMGEEVVVDPVVPANAVLHSPSEEPPGWMNGSNYELDEVNRSPDGFALGKVVGYKNDVKYYPPARYYLYPTDGDIGAGVVLSTYTYAENTRSDGPSTWGVPNTLGGIVDMEGVRSMHVVIDVMHADGSIHRYVFEIERVRGYDG